MKILLSLLVILFISSESVAQPVQAENEGTLQRPTEKKSALHPYFGFGAGMARHEVPEQAVFIPGSFAAKAYLGISVNKYFSGEISHALLGIYSKPVGSYTVFGTSGSVLGYLPLGESVRLHGKGGIFQWELRQGEDENGNEIAPIEGNDFMYGIGIEFNLKSGSNIRIEWETYKNVGEQDNNNAFKGDIKFFSIGVNFPLG